MQLPVTYKQLQSIFMFHHASVAQIAEWWAKTISPTMSWQHVYKLLAEYVDTLQKTIDEEGKPMTISIESYGRAEAEAYDQDDYSSWKQAPTYNIGSSASEPSFFLRVAILDGDKEVANAGCNVNCIYQDDMGWYLEYVYYGIGVSDTNIVVGHEDDGIFEVRVGGISQYHRMCMLQQLDDGEDIEKFVAFVEMLARIIDEAFDGKKIFNTVILQDGCMKMQMAVQEALVDIGFQVVRK